MQQYREGLTEIPERIKWLPVDKRGYPVPWFVAWVNGEPEFRAMDMDKWRRAVRDRLCWVCGGKLGSYLCFVIGPMCGINRTTSEPPCHSECGLWSAQNCPFLTKPHMERREGGMEAAQCPAGEMIRRNPGVVLLWVTKSYSLFKDGKGGYLIRIGDPERVAWIAEGKPATRDQVAHSVNTGLPLLMETAKLERGAEDELRALHQKFTLLYPEGEAGR